MYPSQAAAPSTALGRPASAINTNRTPKPIETSGPETATRNSAPALTNRSLNSATPPKSQRVTDSTSIPSRRATHEWPSSWSRIDARNSRAATIAAPRYAPSDRPGFCDGKTPSASDQTIRAKTAIRLQWSRTSTPPKRPIVKFPFIIRSLRFAAPPPTLGRLRASPLAIERPLTDVRLLAQPVDAGKRPEVHEDDVTANSAGPSGSELSHPVAPPSSVTCRRSNTVI